MSYDAYPDYPGPPLRDQQRPTIWLERLLLAAFVFCILIGLVALALWWSLRSAPKPTLLDDPLHAVRTDLVQPQLALRQLAGDSGAGLAMQAMQAGQLETARAILTYDGALDAVGRAGRLAQLGRRYLDANQPQAAAQIFRLVVPEAVLDTGLPPLERAQLLSQAADGLLKAGQNAAALEAATQAERVAAQWPNLLPAQRSQVFTDLRGLAVRLQDNAFRSKIEDLARNPFLAPQGITIPHRLPTFAQPLPYDAATQAAIDARVSAAKLLADRIALTGGVDIDPERTGLAQALLAEDQARTQFYQQARGGSVSLPQQTWLLQDRIEWLLTKLRVAQNGFGLPIVPQWAEQADALLQELGVAYNELAAALDAHAAAQPTPADQALQRVENEYWLAEQAERGLFTAISMLDLGERVRIVQDDATRQAGALALPIRYEEKAALPGFRIQQPTQ